MAGSFAVPVVVALAFGGLTSALVPADPTITSPAVLPRQNNDRFIGWVESDNTWYSETCSSGLTWYQDGKYAQCCATTLQGCPAPTACVQGTMIYPFPSLSTTISIACTENYNDTRFSICNTAFIFENTGDSSPNTDIVCGHSSVNWSYYRSIPASATEVVVSSNAFSIPQVVSTAINAPTRTARPSSSTGSSSSSDKSESKAWIAGAVIGPIVGLALVGLGIFFLLRRRKNKKAAAPPPAAAAMNYNPSQQPPVPYTDNKPQSIPTQAQGYNQQTSPPIPQPYGQTAQQDPYAQQGAYGAQQAYGAAPVSPVPQYTSPVQQQSPHSPPPQHEYYNQPQGQDTKYGYNASELSGVQDPNRISQVSPTAAYAPPLQTQTGNASPAQGQNQAHPQAAELGDNLRMAPGEAYFDGAELAATSPTPKPGVQR
ncbi:hypothetical protein T440DRAFT_30098 [Plenodomus tracheiphilus IPT5]|uniref:Mid2 domain-containing protein n=1 Tax=Plenodomus tracheiphilus IPT5 TaxID=1408161 RepID=A0A6A7BDJ5_9PLEO|nr:hypothetical protein T440DRAFT_30098 [Plenodomus tracheiphilus IPT5]